MSAPGTCDRWRSDLVSRRELILDDLRAFLSIPSVSALPEHAADVRAAAEWLVRRLHRAGIANVRLLEGEGAPFVYGEWLGVPGAPTVLIYGHYDVQPADPLEKWTTPPFSPDIRDERIFARGASDDKGNLLVPVVVAEALLRTRGALPVNVKFLFEGEEEILSPHLETFLAAHRERLACDLAVSADGWQWSESQGDLRLGLRGLAALEVTVETASSDLHSGMYGGAVPNAAQVMATLLASLHDPATGRVLVEGFYDDVPPLAPDVRHDLAAIPHDDEALRRSLGTEGLHGEAGFTTRERIGVRPSLEINGLSAGFAGEGVKTIIPALAQAKITCRLVSDQDPPTIAGLVERHLHRHAPQSARLTVARLANMARPFAVSKDHPGMLAARDVLVALYGREPYYTRSGGSIPILDALWRQLGVATVIFGFGLPNDNIHAPDESLRLDCLDKGFEAYGMLLDRLATCTF